MASEAVGSGSIPLGTTITRALTIREFCLKGACFGDGSHWRVSQTQLAQLIDMLGEEVYFTQEI